MAYRIAAQNFEKQGFGIEETKLENVWAIRKLVIMQMTALLKIIQMNIDYADSEGRKLIEELFDKEQIEVLEMMNSKLQGKVVNSQTIIPLTE
ncbi:hypothetical protein [uncultured Polaribacter sp.]|uniref:hypothetical protein n=1 Tax=uncultured Polaribacter sp. TaxID=174711 RepID=UPI002611E79E|nr:hypothetical protein [uncultured Polaribacter sp.]